MNRILILGGAGFIGFNLAKALARKPGNRVTVADNFYSHKRDSKFDKEIDQLGINLIEADFTDMKSFEKLDSSYDHFYMLASVVGVSITLEEPHEIIRINTALINNSINWLSTVDIANVIFTSTSECYSGTTDYFNYPIPTDESVPLSIVDVKHPRFTYAITKMLGESGFIHACNSLGIKVSIIRYNNIIGPRMGFKHVVPNLVKRFMAKENPFVIYGPDQTRSFCYVDDAVLATISVMEDSSITRNEIYHVGSDNEVTIRELVEKTAAHFNYNGPFLDGPPFPGSVDRRCPDISKLKKDLNFSVGVSLDVALDSTIDWYIDYYNKNEELLAIEFKDPSKY